MSVLDLSFRHKFPLWGSFLVILTVLTVSVTLMVETYWELEEDLEINMGTVARALAPQLFPAMVRDDVWAAYEAVRTPLRDTTDADPNVGHVENIIVLDNQLNVFVAANPILARMQRPV